MKLKNLMKSDPETVHPDDTLHHAAKLMKTIGAGVLPVMDNNRLVGMITDRDIAVRAVAEGKDPYISRVKEIMTKDAVYCRENDSVKKAGRKMLSNKVGRLPVLDQAQKLTGIISLADIIANRGGKRMIAGRIGGSYALPLIALVTAAGYINRRSSRRQHSIREAG